ncbi:MAG: hypothetical protein KF709_11035 [Gemmatimonadaceae bacterium]|nr:hypothetical protein [Gemmatimonadaceae bacterium]
MIATTTRRVALAFAALTLIAACGGGDPAADEGREIELAPAAADAPMNDAAATPPSSSTSTPAPAPTKSAAPAPARPSTSTASNRSASLAVGTAITVASADKICTNTHKVGDRFTATVTEAVAGSNGGSLAAGTAVTLEVVESERGENSQEKVKLAFKPISIDVAGQTRTLAADITQVAKLEYVRVQSTGTQAKKVATGAAIGAVAGQLLGKDTKSTVAGAAVGAVAGGAVAAATTDYNGCLAANAPITVTLTEAMNLR